MALLGAVLAPAHTQHRCDHFQSLQLPRLPWHLTVSDLWAAAPIARQRGYLGRLLHAVHRAVLLHRAAPRRGSNVERPLGPLAGLGVEPGADRPDGVAFPGL